MTFSTELRLPAKQQFAYINITVTGETIEEFNENLADLSQSTFDDLKRIHDQACDTVNPSTSRANVAKAKAASVTILDSQDKATASELIKSELGGKVVSETETKKPWDRPKPATAAVLEDF